MKGVSKETQNKCLEEILVLEEKLTDMESELFEDRAELGGEKEDWFEQFARQAGVWTSRIGLRFEQ